MSREGQDLVVAKNLVGFGLPLLTEGGLKEEGFCLGDVLILLGINKSNFFFFVRHLERRCSSQMSLHTRTLGIDEMDKAWAKGKGKGKDKAKRKRDKEEEDDE
jgi:hypothetical protein